MIVYLPYIIIAGIIFCIVIWQLLNIASEAKENNNYFGGFVIYSIIAIIILNILVVCNL